MIRASLKEKLKENRKIIVIPGVYDALSAKIAEKEGFEAIFQTGYGSSAALLGMPDYGFLNAGETTDNARRIIRAVNIPVIVDVDTGYGNPLTVWRLVKDLQKIGAAGIFLEDQVWPKRCGHMAGKEIVSEEIYLQKLNAAIDARENEDFIIVARTDARAPMGLDQAITRGKAYKNAGADVIFIEAPQSIEELRIISEKVDAPLVANMIEDGITPYISAKELEKIGFKIALFPLSSLFASTYAMKKVFSELKEKGTARDLKKDMVSFNDFNELVDLGFYKKIEEKYSRSNIT